MIRVEQRGPLFSPSATGLIDNAVDEIGETLAQKAYNEVRKQLRSALQNPTGRYESRVQTSNQADTLVISDGGVVYGPWLEGTSSRNSQTRFKGYSTFRKVKQKLDSEAAKEAQRIIDRAVEKLS